MSTSRPTEPNRRVCRTNTTRGSFHDLSSYVQFTRRSSRTGIVYNVTPRAVGIIVNKIVGNRYIEKRVNVRIEHIKHSKCRQEFLDRVKKNTAASAEAKKSGGVLVLIELNRRVLLMLLVQNVLPSSGYHNYPVPATPSRRRTTLLRRWFLFHTRPRFECFVLVLLWMQSKPISRSRRDPVFLFETNSHGLTCMTSLDSVPRPSDAVGAKE